MINSEFILLIKQAISKNDIYYLKQLINENNINDSNENHYTPLHLAIINENEEAVLELLKCKADPNLITNTNYNSLHLALMKNTFNNIFKMLLKFGANPNQQSEKGYTPLHLAIINENEEAVLELLKCKADPNLITNTNYNSLHLALMKNTFNNIFKMLLKFDANPNQQSEKGYTPLHLAIINENEEAVLELLKCKADLNQQSENYYTPLHLAITKQNINIIKLLLKSWISIDKNKDYEITFDNVDFNFKQKLINSFICEYQIKYREHYENKIKVDTFFESERISNLKEDLTDNFLQYLTPYTKKIIKKEEKIILKCLEKISNISYCSIMDDLKKEEITRILSASKEVSLLLQKQCVNYQRKSSISKQDEKKFDKHWANDGTINQCSLNNCCSTSQQNLFNKSFN